LRTEKPTAQQKQYIIIICNYLDLEYPELKTKKEAEKWLIEFVPIYKTKQIMNSLYVNDIRLLLD